MVFGVLVAGFIIMSKHEETQLDHLRKDMFTEKIEPLSREWEEKYATLEEENEKLHKELTSKDDLEKQVEKERNESLEQSEKLGKKIDQLTWSRQKLRDNIQLMSKTALLEK